MITAQRLTDNLTIDEKDRWKKIQEKLPKNKQNDWDPYEKWYDGSDLRGWWD